MLAFKGNRHLLMEHMGRFPTVVEVGVHKGANAAAMLERFEPERMTLIDAWSASTFATGFTPFAERPDWVVPTSEVGAYYGGDPAEQATLDRNRAETVARFEGDARVEIVRAGSTDALDRFADRSIDLLYIDAGHQYEYVLRDLRAWEPKVAADGVIMMNDCISSQRGQRQNLGVLPATTTFLKHAPFVPVAITLTDWADVVLARRGPRVRALLESIAASNRAVELPDTALANAHTRRIGGANVVSFA